MTISLHLAATGDLLKRYGAVFRHAWQQRRQLEAPRRRPYEAEFLPAALELVDTPVSPAPRIAVWLLISLAALALVWACIGRIDIVATAPGKLIPSEHSKIVQSPETATVTAIHVREGQSVRAGQALIQLDATLARADRTRLANDLLAARAQSARARVLLAALPELERAAPAGGSGATAPSPALRLPALAGADAARQTQEERLLQGQQAELQGKLARLDADLARRQAERAAVQEQVRRLEQTVPLARRRAADFKNLADQHFVAQHAWLEKEQLRIEQEGELAVQKSRLDELAAAIREGREQRSGLLAETRRQLLDNLNEAQQRSVATGQEHHKADSRDQLLTLSAPVDGTVQQLAIHTVGGVVTPAQALLVVVPKESVLEIEAQLDNKDIGFVTAGQAAEVKVETFPFTRYGTIPGQVSHVSGDAIADEKRGLVYAARVALERSTIRVGDKRVNLAPGMAVTVEIRTGSRRVIEYFLSPLIQAKDESLRER